MSKKTSFQVVVSLNGKELRRTRFAVGANDTAIDVRRAMMSCDINLFSADVINALKWGGVAVLLKQDTKAHQVDNPMNALKWVLGAVK